VNRCFYTLCLRVCAPLIWLWMGRRARRAGGVWQIFAGERFGRYGTDRMMSRARPVWVHTVSLGETRAAQPLVQALLEDGLPVLLTHTTATGRAEGARLFGVSVASGQLVQAWLPYDFPGSTRRFFAYWQPRCGVLIEREVWPNLLAQARRAGVPMVLASARFSAASLKQARWLGEALREALAGLYAVLAQSEGDAERLRQAGANAVCVAGNLKFDCKPAAELLAQGRAWRNRLKRPVLAIASTREGEDDMFVRALCDYALKDEAEAGPTPLIWLIPRHPQRFDEAAARCVAGGLSYVRRSRGEAVDPPAASVRVALGDTLGEMPFYYGASDVAIVAGSFAPLGGQNLIEACAAGVPVIVGPHTHHFADAVRDAVAAGAALQVADAATAIHEAMRLLRDPSRRAMMGQAGVRWTAGHVGATRRILAALPPQAGVFATRRSSDGDVNPASLA